MCPKLIKSKKTNNNTNVTILLKFLVSDYLFLSKINKIQFFLSIFIEIMAKLNRLTNFRGKHPLISSKNISKLKKFTLSQQNKSMSIKFKTKNHPTTLIFTAIVPMDDTYSDVVNTKFYINCLLFLNFLCTSGNNTESLRRRGLIT